MGVCGCGIEVRGVRGDDVVWVRAKVVWSRGRLWMGCRSRKRCGDCCWVFWSLAMKGGNFGREIGSFGNGGTGPRSFHEVLR